MQEPTDQHIESAKHVFWYLRYSTDYKLHYNGTGQSGLIGYSDSDWGKNKDNRRSTTGFVFLIADGPVTWALRMQKTVAKSSTEAEYMALSEPAQKSLG